MSEFVNLDDAEPTPEVSAEEEQEGQDEADEPESTFGHWRR